MRPASFFILSLALHIGALLYLVSFRDRTEMQFFPVTILAVGPAPVNATPGGSGAPQSSRVKSKSAAISSRPAKPATEVNSRPSQPEQQAITAETAATMGKSQAVVSEFLPSSDTDNAPAFWGEEPGLTGVETAGSGGRGNRADILGTGSGNENGQGIVDGAAILTQARYNNAPTPTYPESARRDGREGRVLLRVLVDVQGRAKSVEINSSSGNQVLDQAAAEAIRRWRFHPARYGAEPVESWIRIPIEFRLASANSR